MLIALFKIKPRHAGVGLSALFKVTLIMLKADDVAASLCCRRAPATIEHFHLLLSGVQLLDFSSDYSATEVIVWKRS